MKQKLQSPMLSSWHMSFSRKSDFTTIQALVEKDRRNKNVAKPVDKRGRWRMEAGDVEVIRIRERWREEAWVNIREIRTRRKRLMFW